DDEVYLVVFEMEDDKPYELAFQYAFSKHDDSAIFNEEYKNAPDGTHTRLIPVLASRPKAELVEPTTRQATGIVLADTTAVVCGVVKGSPADKAGIKPGDR